MRTPRVFVTEIPSLGSRVELPEAEGRHLSLVLRRRSGDAVELLTPAGRAFAGRILEVLHGRVAVEVSSELPRDAVRSEAASRIAITVGLAVVKGQSFELALRMATELGIDAVVPLFTSRTVVRWDASSGPSGKHRRYERIAREAAKQCGRVTPLRLLEGVAFRSWIESVGRAEHGTVPRWIATPGAPLPEGPGDLRGGRNEVVFAVGPEGGFTEAEVEAAVSSGWRPCGFPTPVLRTPTAVALIAALGLVWRED